MDKRELLFSFLGKETISPTAKKAADAVDKLGEEFKATGKDAKNLDKEIDLTKGKLSELAVAFARTEDAAGRVDITKKMREQQRELSKLTKARKFIDLDDAGDDAASGFAARFIGRLGPLVASAPLGPAGAAAGATIGATAAPIIGGLISAAIVGGAGIGGVIGGVTLAARDPRVASAGSQLGKAVMKDLEDFSQVFVGPTLDGIKTIQGAWRYASGDIQKIFQSASRYVVPLARGVSGLAREALPGIRKAVEAAGPVIREISVGLPRLGRSIGDLFGSSAENANEAAAAVRGLFLGLEQIIKIVGVVAGALSMMAKPVIIVGKAIATVYDTLLGWIPGIGSVTQSWRDNWNSMDDALKDFSESGVASTVKVRDAAGDLAVEQENLRRNIAEAAGAARDQRSALDELATAIRSQTDPMFALIEAQNGLKDSQSEYNQAVKEHGKNSPQAKQALRDMAQAALEVESATGAAAGMFNGKLSPALRATLSAAGFTEAQIADLEKQFVKAQAKGDKFAKNYQASAGLTDNASPKIPIIQRKIDGLHGKTVIVHVKYEESGRRQGEHIIGHGTKLKGLASGGPVIGPGPKGVDSVPRMLAPGEFVLSARDVDRMGGFQAVEKMRRNLGNGGTAVMARASSAGGGININGPVYVTANNPDEFIEQLRKKARGNGGVVRFIDEK
ncbi:hypothetical protein O7630_06740 [Micromonospora sp. WMMD718]|uniref:hypothetical protein n=1 Tax=unclassified Micromonospora TaxID=2617518 RepID=UPI000ACD3E88|nr:MULTISPECIES: hypothetical protein [unclassified Micromonospora]MDG4750628.1 hypothetical protein [Micromonospora sp. WMMD718]